MSLVASSSPISEEFTSQRAFWDAMPRDFLRIPTTKPLQFNCVSAVKLASAWDRVEHWGSRA